MKVALMFAGGTIDSFKTFEGRVVSEDFDPTRYQPILEFFAQEYPDHACEVVKPPFRIDSSQLVPSHLSGLIAALRALLFTDESTYDAVIVAFGTDTLSYALPSVATALGANLNKCVVFVTGMTSWDENLDGRKNLIDAMRVAVSGKYYGVMAVIAGRIFPPVNLRKVSHDALDPFREIRLRPRDEFKPLSEVLNAFLARGESVNRPLGASQVVQFQPPVDIGSRYIGQPIRPVVAQRLVYPGLTTQMLTSLVQHGIEHVILWCYANGTACVEEGPYSLPAAIRELRQAGVAVYAVSQQIGAIAPQEYQVCEDLIEAGCLYVTRFTAETLYSVLLILAAISPSAEDVRAIIAQVEQV